MNARRDCHGDSAQATATTPLEARHVRLVPVGTTLLPFVHGLLSDPDISFRHLLAGEAPGPVGFSDVVTRNVLVQFVIQLRMSQRPVGLARAVAAHVGDRRATVSVASAPRFMGSGLALEGAGLLVDYLFSCLGLRKVYAEVPEFNLSQFPGITEYMSLEVRLRDHTYYAGRYWDLLVLAMDEVAWADLRTQFLNDLVVDAPPPRRNESERASGSLEPETRLSATEAS